MCTKCWLFAVEQNTSPVSLKPRPHVLFDVGVITSNRHARRGVGLFRRIEFEPKDALAEGNLFLHSLGERVGVRGSRGIV